MTLSYSRHQYVELVFDQRMETWVGCHRRAFESFGGAPREIVIDNLKAAVIKAALESPILSEPHRRMAQHYGILVHPYRPGAAEHKGKVENGVRYVQRSFMAGREFIDIEEANAKLLGWVVNEAGVREHGTTHEALMKRFAETEASGLMELPDRPFELVRVAQCTVARDTFIALDGSYYQAPYQLVGRKLDVYVYERTVQIYDGVELLVTHERATRKGQRMTREEFYPPQKSLYVTRPREQCSYPAHLVEPRCSKLVDGLLSERPLDKLRSVHGILRLGEKYGNARLEAACSRALHYGDGSYVRVAKILESGLDKLGIETIPNQMSLPIHQYSRSAEEFFGDISSMPVLARVEAEVGRC